MSRSSLYSHIFTYIVDPTESLRDMVIFSGALVVVWLLVSAAFFFTGTALVGSILGGILFLLIAYTGWQELGLSLFIALMLKIGGDTAVSLIVPEAVQTVFVPFMKTVHGTSFLQLVLGIFIILFFLLLLPRYALGIWRRS